MARPEPSSSGRGAGALDALGGAIDEAARAHQQAAPEVAQGTAAGAQREASPKDRGDRGAREAPGTFYMYTDHAGQQHIVDSVELVPKVHRKRAKRWVLEEEPAGETPSTCRERSATGLSSLATQVGRPAEGPSSPAPLHLPSFMLGVVAAAVVFLGYHVIRMRSRFWIKAAGMALAVAIAGAGYFGWLRRQAGLSDDVASHPAAVLQDAEQAARLLERHNAETLRALEAVDDAPPSNVNLLP